VKREINTFSANTMIALALGAIVVSCGQDKIQTVSSDEVAGIPSERADSLTIVSTENGKVRYKIVAKTADRYQSADTPYYDFPHGLYAASFTEDGALESDIVADSASLRPNPDFFTSYGNVIVKNEIKSTRVETQGPLYWDAAKKTIYTDEYAVVYTPTDTVPAHKGLITDDQLKNTVFYGVIQGAVNRVFTPERDSTAAIADTGDANAGKADSGDANRRRHAAQSPDFHPGNADSGNANPTEIRNFRRDSSLNGRILTRRPNTVIKKHTDK
jgi:lipopolysaccharide export system protein LptC